MGRVKAVSPSLREKKRYIVYEILSKNKIKAFSSVSRAIWASTLSFNGELETGKAGIWLIPEKYDAQSQRGIMKVSNKYVEKAKAALALVNKIDNQKVIIRSVATSGILNKAERYIAG